MKVAAALMVVCGCAAPSQPIPVGSDEVEAPGCDGGRLYGSPPPPYEVTVDGQPYVVRAGKVWKPTGAGTGQPISTLYDPAFLTQQFTVEGCTIFRLSDDRSQKFPVGKTFTADFENAADVQALIGIDAGFTGFVLQSPQAPTVPDYVALRACLLARTCGFKDNRLEVLAAAGVDGGTGLRATSLAPVAPMITAKASIETELVHFVRGDVVTIGGWFRVVEGKPYGLIDLEAAFVDVAPGPRVLIEGGALEVELKWGDKPRFRQASPATPFPLGPWVRVDVEFTLEPDAQGRVRLWQDGALLIDREGQTLPLPNTILNSLELGITANNETKTVLDVDGVTVR